MESSFLSFSNAPNISRIAARLKAFLFSGRLIVILATAPRFSTKMYFLSMSMNKSFLKRFQYFQANNTALLPVSTGMRPGAQQVRYSMGLFTYRCHPRMFSSGVQFRTCLDSRLKHAGMTDFGLAIT